MNKGLCNCIRDVWLTIIVISDAPIIGLVIGVSHYQPLFLVFVSVISERCNQYCNKCTNNNNCDYSITNCFNDTHNFEQMLTFIERIRKQ